MKLRSSLVIVLSLGLLAGPSFGQPKKNKGSTPVGVTAAEHEARMAWWDEACI